MRQHAEGQPAIEVRRNDRYTGSPNEAQALSAWHRESLRIFGPTPEPEPQHREDRRRLNHDLRQTLKALAPDLYARATALSEAFSHPIRPDFRDRVHVRAPLYLGDAMDKPWTGGVPVSPPPDGFFWWAQTQAFGNDGGLQAQFDSDGLHFFGSIDYRGDARIQRNIGATATFVLDPSRRPPSANGRWRSRPWVELFGRIDGYTGFYDWLWAADDKWCKCRVFLRQTAIQFVGPIPFIGPLPAILASNTDLRTLIDEENQSRSTHADLPGFQPMPFIEFGVADPNVPVIVDLEVRFDIELEGDSLIGFSPQPNPFQSVLLRHFQWQVEAI